MRRTRRFDGLGSPPVGGDDRAWSSERLATFGRRLLAAMTLADVSADELAERIGPDISIGVSTLHRITAGKRQPRPWEIPVFARELGVPEEFLLHGLPVALATAETPESARAALVDLDRRLQSLEGEMAEAVRLGRESLELLEQLVDADGPAASEAPQSPSQASTAVDGPALHATPFP